MRDALERVDVVVTSGGVSMGEKVRVTFVEGGLFYRYDILLFLILLSSTFNCFRHQYNLNCGKCRPTLILSVLCLYNKFKNIFCIAFSYSLCLDSTELNQKHVDIGTCCIYSVCCIIMQPDYYAYLKSVGFYFVFDSVFGIPMMYFRN